MPTSCQGAPSTHLPFP